MACLVSSEGSSATEHNLGGEINGWESEGKLSMECQATELLRALSALFSVVLLTPATAGLKL